jgi:hypothetical protein
LVTALDRDWAKAGATMTTPTVTKTTRDFIDILLFRGKSGFSTSACGHQTDRQRPSDHDHNMSLASVCFAALLETK